MNDAINDAPPPTAVPAPRSSASAWRSPWFYVALAALGLSGWQWSDTRARLADTRQEMARRLAETAAVGQAEQGFLKQAQEQVEILQSKVGMLEARQAELQSQAQEFQTLYLELSRGRDDAVLLEIEQAVTLAAQQLQLAGNVQAAVLALQAADARLARLDRPQFLALRKTLARDLERLRILPFVDLPGVSLKLEGLLVAIDKLPLAVDERLRSPDKAAGQSAATSESPWWRRLGEEFGQEIRDLVRIQRFDRNEPVLLAPEQAFFLRENLKLRLLNARLALFARDAWTFHNELKVAQGWLTRHFDSQDKGVQAAQSSLRQLGAAEVNIELPNLGDSLAALRGIKPGREKK